MTPNANPRVVYRDLADGGVLLHLGSGQYHSLNTTGSAIWKLIDGTRTSDDIATQLQALLDDPPEHLGVVVTDFLEGLRARDLIVA